jgi:hypothetical protein
MYAGWTLTLYSHDINMLKFNAADSFQEYYCNNNGCQLEQGLFPYLQDEGRLAPSMSRNVQRGMLASSDMFIDSLEDKDILQAQVIESLQDNFTSMKLY